MKRVFAALCFSALCLWADGHGPAFGFSTATLGAGDSMVGTAMTLLIRLSFRPYREYLPAAVCPGLFVWHRERAGSIVIREGSQGS
jgi:hypothetical protein